MDVETVEAIEAVRHDIQAVRGEVQDVRGEVRELRGEVQDVRHELRGEIKAVRGEMQTMRGEMQTLHTEDRHYTKLLYESLHDDIRIVAEGLAMLSVKVDALTSGRQAP